ncbi:MAG: cytochrome c oxidase subunit II [Mycobacteriales bacterium]
MRTRSSRAVRLALAVGVTALLTSGCTGREAYESSFALGWPHPASAEAKVMYDVWLGTVAAAAAVGFGMYLLIGIAIVRDRKKSDELPPQIRYNLSIEILYTSIPFVIIAVLFFYTAVGENKVNKLTPNPDVRIGVVGFQWNWQFNYLDDKVQVTGAPPAGQEAVLVLPVNKRIRFIESSPDVIHSFWVPDFLFKRDVVPGRLNTFEMTPTRIGTYTGRCAELCGEKHAAMNFTVKVVSDSDYRAYIADLQAHPEQHAPNSLGAALTTGDN